jgi:integrase
MKIQKVRLPDNKLTWLVLDNNYLPIHPIQMFMRYLENLERSPNTLRAYAHNLKLYWEYLAYIKKPWATVKFTDVAEFISWLCMKDPTIIYLQGEMSNRTESTINTILTTLSCFYTFHHRLGNTTLTLTIPRFNNFRHYKSLLSHIKNTKPTQHRLLKLKQPKKLPKTITSLQAEKLIKACNTLRDQFLLCLLYETGMRIGQALGLRHVDVCSWDNEIHIQPRTNNINEARSKSVDPYIVHVTPKLMQLYSLYVIKELENVNSDYVFVQLRNQYKGQPLKYSAIVDLFSRLTKKTGIYITPHMFRHTHATELLRSGWDCVKIQKRLGHAGIQTTIDTYAHLATEDLKLAFIAFQKQKEKEHAGKI